MGHFKTEANIILIKTFIIIKVMYSVNESVVSNNI